MKKVVFVTFFMVVWCIALPMNAQQYVVGEGDVMKITVYDHADLAQTVRVDGDGTIMVAFLGKVPVSGLTVTQVSEKLTRLYADGYLIEPQIGVFMEDFSSRKATILGQVSKPGLYEIRQHITFLELISTAGGLTADAGDMAVIKRKQSGDEKEQIIKVDLKRLVQHGDTALNIPIEAGDNIYIQKAQMVYVNGEVKKPGLYKCENETTVIKAITLAGGFTDKAAATRVKIIRKKDGTETILENVKMDRMVYQDDVLVVPESFF
ncbi:MAG: SLBB domain-containing protein [Desulfobacterales bacterium]|jgi:polysaccharide export outer membrane protein|nr:SLBB domain-containing protein [Desulfobacterales bacterium]